MKKLILITLISLTCFTSFTTKTSVCGTERWDIKTLTDSSASKINFIPQITTISQLILINPYKKIKNHDPRFGVEFNTYKIDCGIREYRNEADNDTHLVLYVLTDPTKTMIGEIPNCPEVNSHYQSDFDSSRVNFLKYILPNHLVQEGTYELTGVAFFDKPHGQLGHSIYAIELHPVLTLIKIK